MDPHYHSSSSSLSCEIRIIRAKNTKAYTGDLFVRCYLSAGNNRRVRLDTQKISSNSDSIWNQTFSLDCLGTENSIKQIKHASVVFELRSRSTTPLISRMNGSKLVGRAEVQWQDVFESKGLQIEKWAVMDSGKTSVDSMKLPAVQLGMRIRDQLRNGIRREENHEECDCKDCQSNLCHLDFEYYAAL